MIFCSINRNTNRSYLVLLLKLTSGERRRLTISFDSHKIDLRFLATSKTAEL